MDKKQITISFEPRKYFWFQPRKRIPAKIIITVISNWLAWLINHLIRWIWIRMDSLNLPNIDRRKICRIFLFCIYFFPYTNVYGKYIWWTYIFFYVSKWNWLYNCLRENPGVVWHSKCFPTLLLCPFFGCNFRGITNIFHQSIKELQVFLWCVVYAF